MVIGVNMGGNKMTSLSPLVAIIKTCNKLLRNPDSGDILEAKKRQTKFSQWPLKKDRFIAGTYHT